MERKQLTDTVQNIIKCSFIDDRSDLGWSQRAVDAEEVCGETGNVRSSHGSSVDGVGLPVVPGGSDLHSGSPDINGGTIIGEVGLRVIDIRSGDGDRLFSAGGRDVSRVLIFVSGGNDNGDTTVVKLKMESHVSDVSANFHPPSTYPFNGSVNTDSRFVTQARRNDGGFASPQCMLGDPISAGDTVVQRRRSVTGSDEGGRRLTSERLGHSPRHLQPSQR